MKILHKRKRLRAVVAALSAGILRQCYAGFVESLTQEDQRYEDHSTT